MKKFSVLLIALVLGFCFTVCAHAASTTIAAAYINPVSKDRTRMLYSYEGTTVVATETGQFKVPIPEVLGSLVRGSFKSASDDCTVWVATKEDAAFDDPEVILRFNNVDGGYGTNFLPQAFRNRDATEDAYLYITVRNDDTDTDTGVWQFDLVFDER